MYLRNVYNQRLHHTQSTQQPQTMQQKVGSMVKDSPMAQQAVRTITSSVPREQMAQAMQQTKETAKEMMDTAATEVEKTKVAAKELLGSGSSSGMSTPKSEASSESATPSKKVEDSVSAPFIIQELCSAVQLAGYLAGSNG
jgi:hypothetical protein